MSPNDDGGYVHDPSRFDETGERIEAGTRSTADGESDPAGDGTPEREDDWLDRPVNPVDADRTFDWRGWLLVGVIVIAFVFAPLGVLLYPPEAEGYRFALILFPLIPAVILGATAVWATTRP